MNLSFYTATTGAIEQQDRLDVHGNNIANINTYGFRSKIPSFSQLITQDIRGVDDDLARGVGAKMIEADTNFTTTGLTGTGRQLDYAIDGDGFFGLVDPLTGEFSYTRDGSFILSSYQEDETVETYDEFGNVIGEETETVTHWYLSDGMGRFVLSADGSPLQVENYEDTADMLNVGIFDFVNYDGMLSMGDNRFTPVDKNGQVRLGSGTLVQGYLEISNTDLAYEFAKVIETQRTFSMLTKMIVTSDEIETTVNNLR